MEQTTTQRRQADRRRLWDRRAPLLRRSGEDRRRSLHEDPAGTKPDERRSAQGRRSTDAQPAAAHERRAGSSRRRRERRRTTPVPYNPTQFEELRARFAAASGPVACPACGGRFSLGPAVRNGGVIERLVLCMGCGRGTVVPDAGAARVLLISAVTPLRNLLREMLSGAGHDVIEADDAAVGLDAYQTIPADVVIVDVVATGRLPAPDFLRQLRQGHPDARVAALAGRTSYAGMDPLQVVEGLGDVRTVRVPVSRDSLLRTVQELRG